MKWFLLCTCRCSTLKQHHIITDALLWNFLLACIWTHGSQVVLITGEQFSYFWKRMSRRKRSINLRTRAMVKLLVTGSSFYDFAKLVYSNFTFLPEKKRKAKTLKTFTKCNNMKYVRIANIISFFPRHTGDLNISGFVL